MTWSSRRCIRRADTWSAISRRAARRTGVPTTRSSSPPTSATRSTAGRARSGWTRARRTCATFAAARLDKAKARGCDGVEPDNVDGYTNKPGFPLNATTQLDYNRFLATAAHARGLKVALKNDVDQLSSLAASFDFAVNEQCNEYSECDAYSAFTGANKPVFNAEYKSKWHTSASARATMCAKARSQNLRTLVLPLNLDDSFRYSCD